MLKSWQKDTPRLRRIIEWLNAIYHRRRTVNASISICSLSDKCEPTPNRMHSSSTASIQSFSIHFSFFSLCIYWFDFFFFVSVESMFSIWAHTYVRISNKILMIKAKNEMKWDAKTNHVMNLMFISRYFNQLILLFFHPPPKTYNEFYIISLFWCIWCE